MNYYGKSYKGPRIPAVTTPQESEYEGYPTLIFPNPEDTGKSGVSLGVRKIHAVLNHIAEAKAFVAKHTTQAPAKAPGRPAKAPAPAKPVPTTEDELLSILK